MSKCPACRAVNTLQIQGTERTTFVDTGSAIVAGVTLKRSAQQIQVYEMTCGAVDQNKKRICTFKHDCYISGDQVVLIVNRGSKMLSIFFHKLEQLWKIDGNPTEQKRAQKILAWAKREVRWHQKIDRSDSTKWVFEIPYSSIERMPMASDALAGG